MTDFAAPAFGNPALGRQGDKGRKQLKKTYEDTWLDEFLGGMFGGEEPSTSVLSPDRDKNSTSHDIGRRIGSVTDIAGPAKALMLAPLMGAIRLKGAKDLVATHAFAPGRAEAISRSGYLKAPSIGVHAREANDYDASAPQFVFRAGAVDPAKQTGTMVNRDGYFANPTARDPEKLKQEIANYLADARGEYGGKDLRLLQAWPGSSQGLAVGASPSFKSFADFEKHPAGAQLLRANAKGRIEEWEHQSRNLSGIAQTTGQESGSKVAMDIVQKVNRQGVHTLTPDELEAYQRALKSPSAMAEFKMYEHLPLNPNDAYVHVPSGWDDYGALLKQLEPLRDQGFKMVATEQIAAGHPNIRGKLESNAYKHMPDTVPPDGSFNIPKLDWSYRSQPPQAFKDFVNPGAGGSPPLSKVPKGLSPDRQATADWFENAANSGKKGIQELLLDHHDKLGVTEADFFHKHFASHPKFRPAPEDTVSPFLGAAPGSFWDAEQTGVGSLAQDYMLVHGNKGNAIAAAQASKKLSPAEALELVEYLSKFGTNLP